MRRLQLKNSTSRWDGCGGKPVTRRVTFAIARRTISRVFFEQDSHLLPLGMARYDLDLLKTPPRAGDRARGICAAISRSK
jgi:hypothetical protein